PPARGDPRLLAALERLDVDDQGDDPFAEGNAAVIERLIKAQPTLVGVTPAREQAPVLAGKALLHAGPPIAWAAMTGPMRGACIGAALYEGWASSEEDAVRQLEAGEVVFEPCHAAGGVGPMG